MVFSTYLFISLSMISIIMIIQFIIYWCIYIFLYACLCVCTVHTCAHVAEVNIRFLLSCSSPYFLRQAFFPKLRLPHSAGLAGQQALKDPLGSTISVLGLHAHCTCFFFFYTRCEESDIGPCVESTQLNHLFHHLIMLRTSFFKDVTHRSLFFVSSVFPFSRFLPFNPFSPYS